VLNESSSVRGLRVGGFEDFEEVLSGVTGMCRGLQAVLAVVGCKSASHPPTGCRVPRWLPMSLGYNHSLILWGKGSGSGFKVKGVVAEASASMQAVGQPTF
jgi:hypothetical protein